MIRTLWRDAVHLAQVATGDVGPKQLAWAVLGSDSFAITTLSRLRESARALRVPVVNTVLRRVQTILFAVEVDNDVTLGNGVYFVHSLGTVVGGNAKIGNRVRFMGNNTVGTARDDGYPVLDDDVVVGCGARILGPVHIGARSVIGANSVVLSDVPPDTVVVGAPARPITKDRDAAIPYGRAVA